jgi:hypothetical protein
MEYCVVESQVQLVEKSRVEKSLLGKDPSLSEKGF